MNRKFILGLLGLSLLSIPCVLLLSGRSARNLFKEELTPSSSLTFTYLDSGKNSVLWETTAWCVVKSEKVWVKDRLAQLGYQDDGPVDDVIDSLIKTVGEHVNAEHLFDRGQKFLKETRPGTTTLVYIEICDVDKRRARVLIVSWST